MCVAPEYFTRFRYGFVVSVGSVGSAMDAYPHRETPISTAGRTDSHSMWFDVVINKVCGMMPTSNKFIATFNFWGGEHNLTIFGA